MSMDEMRPLLEAEIELRRVWGEQLAVASCCGDCTDPACCKAIVSVSPYEAMLILAAHGEKVGERMDALKIASRAEERDDGPNRYIALQLGCPFLDNGRCAIYDLRPYNCLLHNIHKDSHPKHCAGADGTIASVPVDKYRERADELKTANSKGLGLKMVSIRGLSTAILAGLGMVELVRIEDGE